ncbi:MAG: hypothetical protein KAT93_00505 [Desulfuromonadales bacterium]|nr:hypothetical protein [Desulfuromonadales bacterium]
MLVVKKYEALLRDAGLRQLEDFMNFQGGQLIARKRGRNVVRLEIGRQTFYLKRNIFHWGEFSKTLSRFRWPSRGARDEWEGILAVQAASIPTVLPVAMGERSLLGIELASFTLTEELYNAEPLEDVFQRDFSSELTSSLRREKRELIHRVAKIGRCLHKNGMCHQDFYLGHIFLGSDKTLYLIDLQRVLKWPKVPLRYLIKDLAQMAYSAQVIGGFSRTDYMRFFLTYLDRQTLQPEHKRLVKRILCKCERISRHTVKLLARRRRRGEVK